MAARYTDSITPYERVSVFARQLALGIAAIGVIIAGGVFFFWATGPSGDEIMTACRQTGQSFLDAPDVDKARAYLSVPCNAAALKGLVSVMADTGKQETARKSLARAIFDETAATPRQ